MKLEVDDVKTAFQQIEPMICPTSSVSAIHFTVLLLLLSFFFFTDEGLHFYIKNNFETDALYLIVTYFCGTYIFSIAKIAKLKTHEN